MGLDDFKSSGNTTTASSGGSTGAKKTKSGSTSQTKNVEVDKLKPFFTAAMNQRFESVEVFIGIEAFPRTSRHKFEKILCVIRSKEEYERLNYTCKLYTDKSLERLFKTEPTKAQDFVERNTIDIEDNTTEDNSSDEETCPICEQTINLKSDEYVKVFGEVVHATHEVMKIVDELDEE